MQIYDAKINHLVNPLGFRMPRTVFSWKVKDARGTKQTAARICVSLNPNLQDCLVDTGWDSGADSLAYRVEMELKPAARYYWTVGVRSDAGEEAVSEIQWFETGKREEPWTAGWITCDSTKKRHPFFEKRIEIGKPVEKARLYICGLGLYEAFYNGRKIGDEYLTPYSNDYREWVQYQTYDVTKELQESGVLSILTGNGWYKGRFGFNAHEDIGFYGDEWKLIAELHLSYLDGSKEVIGTDDSWQVRRSNITFSNLYDGEIVDDTLEQTPPEPVRFCDAPKGELTERMSLPVTVHETFDPAELLHTPAGEQVFDMGQEFTGIFSLRVHEPRGSRIHVQTGEILQKGNFYNDNLRTAKSEYIYISDGEEHILTPRFTYYGYRYVKVEGISGLKKEDFKGLALYSDSKQTGSMSTGHDLLNRFIKNVEWGFKGNSLDVPTDCPQRDERMGWTGDAQVFLPTAAYLRDTYAFYAKYLYDMAREQSALEGKVPHVIPSAGVEDAACVWGDAACIMPWNLYLFYGDKTILEDQFESMKSWVDYIRRVDGENHRWRYVFHFGDWLALDNPAQGAEQVLGGTDEEFIANLYYAVSADLVAKAAAVLGRDAEQEEYRKLSKEQFAVVKQEYYSATGRCCIKTQTALLLTLKYHLSDNEELVKKQLRRLFALNDGKLTTGFVGTPIMCQVLSDYGMDDIAFGLLLNEEYPGWLHEVKLGATTVWERWNSLLEDGTISGISMNGMNHYAYGSVLEWVFKYVAGIGRKEEVPGFREICLAPVPNWEIGSMEASYDSPFGVCECCWKLPDQKHIEIKVTVPFGTTAYLTLPFVPETALEDHRNAMFAHVEDGVCILDAGTYQASYKMTRKLGRIYTLDTTIKHMVGEETLEGYLRNVFGMPEIPNEALDFSIREVAEKYPERIGGERLEEIERFLKDYQEI